MSVARSYFVLACDMIYGDGTAISSLSTKYLHRRTSATQVSYNDGGATAMAQTPLELRVTEDLEERAIAWTEYFNTVVRENPSLCPAGSRMSLVRVVRGARALGYHADGFLVFSVEWDPWTPVAGLTFPEGKGYGCPILMVQGNGGAVNTIYSAVYPARTAAADDEVLPSPKGGSLEDILRAVTDAASLS